MHRVFRLFATSAAVSLLASPLQAQLIGAPATSENCAPFGCIVPNTTASRYQQVYAKSSFAGPVNIGTINFFQTRSTTGNLNVGTFTFYLSTTTVAVDALSTNFDANRGANNALFGVFSLTGGPVGGTLSFTGGPFAYDPAQGNLLLDIVANVTTSGVTFLDSRDGNANGVFSRQTDFVVTGSTGYGLVTEFKAAAVVPPQEPPTNSPPTPSTTVPEPSTYALMLGGMAALGLVARRRRLA